MPRTITLTEAQTDRVLHDNVAEQYGLTVYRRPARSETQNVTAVVTFLRFSPYGR